MLYQSWKSVVGYFLAHLKIHKVDILVEILLYCAAFVVHRTFPVEIWAHPFSDPCELLRKSLKYILVRLLLLDNLNLLFFFWSFFFNEVLIIEIFNHWLVFFVLFKNCKNVLATK